MTKDLVTPVPVDEINAVVKKCLEKAALVNYTKMSEAAKIEGRSANGCLICIVIIIVMKEFIVVVVVVVVVIVNLYSAFM